MTVSEVIELEEGGIFALRLDEIRPPALQPLQEVRPRVIEGWEAEETGRQLAAQAEEAAQAIRNGREMAGLRLNLRVERGILRDAFIEDAPPAFVAGVFEMVPDEVRVFEDAGAAVLVRLDAIEAADPTSAESQALIEGFAAQTAQDIAGDAMRLFSVGAQTKAGVRVNQQALNAIHTQLP